MGRALEMTRGRRIIVAGAAVVGLLAALAPAATAKPGPPPGQIPAPDQVVTSRNVKQVANIPKQAPFDGPNSFGTDIAFQDERAYVGNYDGFVVYDISRPRDPSILTQVYCTGAQNDVSVTGNLLFLSTDSSRSDSSCTSTPKSATDPTAWEGIKVFDISDPAAPQYVAAVETDCGSHTNTLVPDRTGEAAYLYISSYSPRDTFPDCQPAHDKISIVKVPFADPAAAAVVAEPVLFPDGGNPGDNGSSATTGCHDITVFPSQDLAAGACMGDGILLDIADREAPRVIERVRDNVNFAFWHSATFNNTGTKVVFTDELGGGGAATCNAATGPNRGANGIYDIVGSGDDRSLVFRSYYKIPRFQSDTENCVAHNGSLVPTKNGSDIMVQSWYQGGVSVWEFSDSANPKEIGFFERGPLPAGVVGGSWSAYWYNGYVYSSDIQKGLDVLKVGGQEVASASNVNFVELNVQTQPVYETAPRGTHPKPGR